MLPELPVLKIRRVSSARASALLSCGSIAAHFAFSGLYWGWRDTHPAALTPLAWASLLFVPAVFFAARAMWKGDPVGGVFALLFALAAVAFAFGIQA